ncbi:MAG: Fur family transcriptional regulator [Janthinobacterium lividum]
MQSNTDTRVEYLQQKLHDSGHRITPQRICILRALLELDTHPSAEEIYAQVQRVSPMTSLATVYKTLDTLRDMGEVLEIQPGDGRQHYDGIRPEFHPHVICTQCGEIKDIEIDGLTGLPGQAQSLSGYEIHAQRVEFYGLCAVCQTQKDNA